MNCWEYIKCGRVPGGDRVEEEGICPAYPDHGRVCAHIEGTLCHGPLELAFTSKAGHCMTCEYYLSQHHEKGEPQEAEAPETSES